MASPTPRRHRRMPSHLPSNGRAAGEGSAPLKEASVREIPAQDDCWEGSADLLERYPFMPKPPFAWLLTGMRGTGKTTVEINVGEIMCGLRHKGDPRVVDTLIFIGPGVSFRDGKITWLLKEIQKRGLPIRIELATRITKELIDLLSKFEDSDFGRVLVLMDDQTHELKEMNYDAAFLKFLVLLRHMMASVMFVVHDQMFVDRRLRTMFNVLSAFSDMEDKYGQKLGAEVGFTRKHHGFLEMLRHALAHNQGRSFFTADRTMTGGAPGKAMVRLDRVLTCDAGGANVTECTPSIAPESLARLRGEETRTKQLVQNRRRRELAVLEDDAVAGRRDAKIMPRGRGEPAIMRGRQAARLWLGNDNGERLSGARGEEGEPSRLNQLKRALKASQRKKRPLPDEDLERGKDGRLLVTSTTRRMQDQLRRSILPQLKIQHIASGVMKRKRRRVGEMEDELYGRRDITEPNPEVERSTGRQRFVRKALTLAEKLDELNVMHQMERAQAASGVLLPAQQARLRQLGAGLRHVENRAIKRNNGRLSDLNRTRM